MIRHVPNILSIARLVMAPILMFLLLAKTRWSDSAALCVFIAASMTDWLDGRVARTYRVRSRLGQFLDPLADKVLVIGTLVVLPAVVPSIPWWAVAVIAVRDIVVTVLRVRLEQQNRPVKTAYLAKVKTTLQMVYVAWVLVLLVMRHAGSSIGAWALYTLDGWAMYMFLMAIVALTLYTGLEYFIGMITSNEQEGRED